MLVYTLSVVPNTLKWTSRIMEDITNINAIPLFGLLVIIKHLTLLQLTCACTNAGEKKKKKKKNK